MADSSVLLHIIIFVSSDVAVGFIHFQAFLSSYQFLSPPDGELDAINFVCGIRADGDLDRKNDLK